MLNVKLIGDFLKKNIGVFLSYVVTFFIAYLNLIVVIDLENNRSISLLVWLFMVLATVLYAFQIRKRMTNKWWILFFPIIYLIFVIGSYFVKVTLNLNNEKFDWMKFYHFWDFNFLITLACIMIVALVFYRYSKYFSNHIFDIISLKKKRYDILLISQFATMFIVTSNQLISSFLSNTLFRVENIKESTFAGQLFPYSLGMYIFFSLVTYSVAKGVSQLIKNKPTPSLTVATSFY